MDIQDNIFDDMQMHMHMDMQENEYDNQYDNDFTNDNSEEYLHVFNNIKGNSNNKKSLRRTLLYLIIFLSMTILKKNRLRFFTELLLNETNIRIFKCISNNFDPNFCVHDYLDKNFRTPDLNMFLKYRTELNNNIKSYINPDLQWLYDNIEALNRCNNNDEFDQDIEFTSPPYLKSIINNLKTLYNYFLKKIEKNNKIKKKVVITYKKQIEKKSNQVKKKIVITFK